jgi:FkbM family methyltransferase
VNNDGNGAVASRPPRWLEIAAGMIRRLPAGRYRIADAVGRRWGGRFVGQMSRRLGGATFEVDFADRLARDAWLMGSYEPQETALMQHLLDSGMTVLDVGANWGYFTLIAAHIVGATGRVLSMEPHPAVYARLQRNLLANGMDNVTAVRIAAAAGYGASSLRGFQESEGNSGTSRLTAPDDANTNAFNVDTVDLDSLLDSFGIGTVDLVKVDIEGAEALAIRGMVHGLKQHRYRHVVMELHPVLLRAHGCSVNDILAAMTNYGYRGWWIDHSPAATRRAAYADRVEIGAFMRPIAAGEQTETSGAGDTWPHALWTAPGVDLPFQTSG